MPENHHGITANLTLIESPIFVSTSYQHPQWIMQRLKLFIPISRHNPAPLSLCSPLEPLIYRLRRNLNADRENSQSFTQLSNHHHSIQSRDIQNVKPNCRDSPEWRCGCICLFFGAVASYPRQQGASCDIQLHSLHQSYLRDDTMEYGLLPTHEVR